MDNERSELIRGLRELADFLETGEAFRTPLSASFSVVAQSADDFAAQSKALGGFREKGADPNYIFVVRKFGPIRLEVFTGRSNVCERVVVGKRQVDAVPAHEEEVVEWRCGSVLAGQEDS